MLRVFGTRAASVGVRSAVKKDATLRRRAFLILDDEGRSNCDRFQTNGAAGQLPFSTSVGGDEAKPKAGQREEAAGTDEDASNLKSSDANQTIEKETGGDAGLDPESFRTKAATAWSSFAAGIGETWQELINSGSPKNINKSITNSATSASDSGGYDGPLDIMVIDESENLTAWERMQRRLTEAPVIQGILNRSEQIYEKSGAKEVKKKVDNLSEDAREVWETSQNPWVYRVSSVYETLTEESPETAALRELRQLDPEFTLESWKENVVEYVLPDFMSSFLKGNTEKLKPWLGESAFKRIAAENEARKKEGVQIDTNVLAITMSQILACEQDTVNKGSPIILLHFMCQQINCVRKKSDNSIVEGSEDDIRSYSYVVAFQREYNEETGELNWKMIDFRFNGAIAFL